MEEKKKRFRPTLTAYRALENEVSELKEQLRVMTVECGHLKKEMEHSVPIETYQRLRLELMSQIEATSNLVADCNAWRERYRELSSRGFWRRVFNK